MNKNVGTADRVFRIVAGLVLLSLLFLLDGEAKWFGLIGIVPLATAAMSWCPLYTLIGIRTCPANRR